MERKIIMDANILGEISKAINPTAATVYAIIIGHRNGKTGECYATQATLAEELGLADKTIRRNLEQLKEKGFIDWKKGSSFSSKANSYIFPKETFDAAGIGEKIEQKKLKAKNKDEKIKDRVQTKKLIGPRPTKEQLEAFAAARSKEKRIENNKSKSLERKEKNEVNALIKECHALAKKYTDLGNENRNLFPDGFFGANFNQENDVKALIKQEKRYQAMCILNNFKTSMEGRINSIEKEIKFEETVNKITMDEAMKVFDMTKEDLSDYLVNIIVNNLRPVTPRSIIMNIKTCLELKGKTLDLEGILAA